jgi:ammonium transporter, Amt family
MSGLISTTGSSVYISLLGALLSGVVAGFIYFYAVKVVAWWEIDDPLEVTQTHLCCGIWGTVNVGLLHQKEGLFYLGTTSLL